MNEDDAIRDLVRAIKGNDKANEALDRLADAQDDGGYGGRDAAIRMHDRIAVERSAA